MKGDSVIVLHGIFRTHRSMKGVAKFLAHEGFDVLNICYPSIKYSLETLADVIHPQIAEFIAAKNGRIHFLGFSMGGLLIRSYLKKYRPERLGRVVMVGTPNKGSEVADFIRNFRLYKKLYGPAGQQLITLQQEFAHIFCDVDFELGIIAGDKPIDYISSRIIGKSNDGKVSVESTFLDGASGHIVLPCNHTFFPTSRIMWRQALSFLHHARFLH